MFGFSLGQRRACPWANELSRHDLEQKIAEQAFGHRLVFVLGGRRGVVQCAQAREDC